jgi:hypothetical protein
MITTYTPFVEVLQATSASKAEFWHVGHNIHLSPSFLRPYVLVSSLQSRAMHNVPNINYLHISNPVAALQWKVPAHAVRNKAPSQCFSTRLMMAA